jgi:transposase-like protein
MFGDTWHRGEVVISINGKKHWLWRAGRDESGHNYIIVTAI